MPELPEVETIRRTLCHKGLVGKRIKHVDLPPSRLLRGLPPVNRQGFVTSFIGETILGLERWGKYIMIRGQRHSLIFHCGMTGTFHWYHKPTTRLPHLYLRLSFRDGEELLFTDPRTFGRIIPLVHSKIIKETWGLAGLRLGADALLTPTRQAARLCWNKTQKSSRLLKSVLLDQNILAGIGNIYADESLFHSRYSPIKPVSFMTLDNWYKLIYHLKKVFRQALRAGGSTLKDYLHPDGLEGRFQSQFTVYSKGGEPCPQCGKPLRKIIVGSRATVYCPSCQK